MINDYLSDPNTSKPSLEELISLSCQEQKQNRFKQKIKEEKNTVYSVVFSSFSSAGGVWSVSVAAVTISEGAC
jgi:hypothetical protein